MMSSVESDFIADLPVVMKAERVLFAVSRCEVQKRSLELGHGCWLSYMYWFFLFSRSYILIT